MASVAGAIERGPHLRDHLEHAHARAACAQRETDVVHERAHDEDAKAAHAQALGSETFSLAAQIKPTSLVGDFDSELSILLPAGDHEKTVEHMSVLGGIVARLSCGQRDVAHVGGMQA